AGGPGLERRRARGDATEDAAAPPPPGAERKDPPAAEKKNKAARGRDKGTEGQGQGPVQVGQEEGEETSVEEEAGAAEGGEAARQEGEGRGCLMSGPGMRPKVPQKDIADVLSRSPRYLKTRTYSVCFHVLFPRCDASGGQGRGWPRNSIEFHQVGSVREDCVRSVQKRSFQVNWLGVPPSPDYFHRLSMTDDMMAVIMS
ncbi:hypothetical protein THAOC_21242, partial [Thalassiosira oceanica]